MAKTVRNYTLTPGLSRFSRSAIYKKKALYKKKHNGVKAAAKAASTTKTVQLKNASGKNGASRAVPVKRSTRHYPTEDTPKPLPVHKAVRPTRLRKSITPGTVLVLLSGKFRGRRVVFLKQLPSGLLLVTGPYAVNGVPLRRIDAAYALATSTKVSVSVSVDIAAVNTTKFDDKYFARPAAAKKEKTSDTFFGKPEEAKKIEASRIADQKETDKALSGAISAVSGLKAYLGARFTLSNGQYPHELKF